MLSPVALEKYFWLLRVFVVLTDDCHHTGLVVALETLLEDQDEPAEEAGGAGYQGQGRPLAQDHPLFSEVEQHHQYLDGQEDEYGDAEDDEGEGRGGDGGGGGCGGQGRGQVGRSDDENRDGGGDAAIQQRWHHALQTYRVLLSTGD